MKIKHENKKVWHVVYTRSRAEKKVYEEFIQQDIECYLPIHKKLRQWKDRKKWVDFPLIPGYCFIYVDKKEHEKVIRTNNVVGFVSFDGKPAIIDEAQIDTLKKILKQKDFEVAVTKKSFRRGRKVEIIATPLIGLRGELLSYRGKNKFVIRIEQINKLFSIELPAEFITLLPEDQ